MAIKIYTDGSCKPNPGKGGWSAIIIYPDGTEQEISGHEFDTTNNRMELKAIISALDHTREETEPIVIYTDSEYSKRGITEWMEAWVESNRLFLPKGDKGHVANSDLWLALNEIVKNKPIEFKWVKAHAKNVYNERADKLANEAVNNMARHNVSDRGEPKEMPAPENYLLRLSGDQLKSTKKFLAKIKKAIGKSSKYNPELREIQINNDGTIEIPIEVDYDIAGKELCPFVESSTMIKTISSALVASFPDEISWHVELDRVSISYREYIVYIFKAIPYAA